QLGHATPAATPRMVYAADVETIDGCAAFTVSCNGASTTEDAPRPSTRGGNADPHVTAGRATTAARRNCNAPQCAPAGGVAVTLNRSNGPESVVVVTTDDAGVVKCGDPAASNHATRNPAVNPMPARTYRDAVSGPPDGS